VAGAGQEAIVFLPALGTTGEMWWPQVEAFRKELLVVCCETGGHDPVAAGGAPWALSDFAAGVEAVLDAVGLLEGHLVGLSLGGMIAQVVAVSRPERVTSLVLASTRSEYPPEGRRQLRERTQTAEREGMGPLVEATIGRWFTEEFGSGGRAQVDRVRRMLATADPAGYAEAARAAASVDTTADLRRISAPTLVVRGDLDAGVPAEAAELLQREIPAATAVTIRGASHLCNVQKPEEFNRSVRDLIKGVRTARGQSDRTEPIAPW
jgi:3-oxoadipate enol-lactonase